MAVLTHDVMQHGLREGDIGTVIHRYADGEAFEVEFLTADGSTVAVLTLDAVDIRPIRPHEILHVREIVST